MKLIDVGVILALIAMAIGLLGLVGLIRPKIFFRASSRKRVGLGLLAAFLLFIFGIVIVGMNPEEKRMAVAAAPTTFKPAAPVQEAMAPAPAAKPIAAKSKPAVQPAAASEPAPAAKAMAAALPADQAKFVVAIAESQRAYRNAKNEMAQGGTRAERRAALCSILRGPSVHDWVGSVTEVSSANDGRGVLGVKIGDKVGVSTTNTSFGDALEHTLIEPGSAVFKSAFELKKGGAVQFSGVFFQDDKDCVKETSLTLDGSMREPEFLFRFTAVKKL
jgi:hypothetical protein